MKKLSFLLTALGLAFLTACNFPTAPRTGGEPLPLPTAPPTSVAAEFLVDPRIVTHDPFDNLVNWKYQNDTSFLKNGVLQMTGIPDWHSHFSYKKQFKDGTGLLISFKVEQANDRSEFVLVTGDWLTDSFRQFGLYNAPKPKADLFQGRLNLGGYNVMGNLTIRPGAWYSLLLAVGRDGHFLAVAWDPNDPAQRAVYDLLGKEPWAGRSWTFYPKATEGETVYMDDFYRIAFTSIK
ncbi:MAG: hypothetical protein ACM3MF_00235 [Anaerolineae bacterium]